MSNKELTKIARAINLASRGPMKTASDVRQILNTLAKADVTWNPDDDPHSIEWSIPLTHRQKNVLSVVNERLWAECDRLGLNIHSETMQAHVRVHGENSPFWPTYRPKEQREYMAFWGNEYTDDGTLKYEIVGADFFCDDNGYEECPVEDVIDLEVGEQIDLGGGLYGEHFVVRIK